LATGQEQGHKEAESEANAEAGQHRGVGVAGDHGDDRASFTLTPPRLLVVPRPIVTTHPGLALAGELLAATGPGVILHRGADTTGLILPVHVLTPLPFRRGESIEVHPSPCQPCKDGARSRVRIPTAGDRPEPGKARGLGPSIHCGSDEAGSLQRSEYPP